MLDSDLLGINPSALAPVDPCGVSGCGRRSSTSLTMLLGGEPRPVPLCATHSRTWAAAAVAHEPRA